MGKAKKVSGVNRIEVIGVDPGNTGGLVYFNGDDFDCAKMPVNEERFVCFDQVWEWLLKYPNAHVFLERAAGYGQGPAAAFTYGRGFAALEIAIRLSEQSVTYIEPSKWTRSMHKGLSKDLKPKAKSALAVKRLYPKLVPSIPKGPRSGKLDEGVVDALLIAGYGYNAFMGV